MSPRLKILGSSTLAFGVGVLAVLGASCLQVGVTPKADAQATPDFQTPVDSKPPAVDQGAITEIQALPFAGQVTLFAGNFAPKGWAFCNGQLLNIADHGGLFSVLGATYGGDGRTTFALPDLRGRVPLHAGQGRGLQERRLGETGGKEAVTLSAAEMPKHSHALSGSTDSGNLTSPLGNALAADTSGYSDGETGMNAMHAQSIGETGGGEPHQNMQPYLALNYIIALGGPVPARN